MSKLLEVIAIWLPPMNVILLLTLGMLQVVNSMLISISGKSIKLVDWYTIALNTQTESGITEFILYIYYMISFMFTTWIIQLIF